MHDTELFPFDAYHSWAGKWLRLSLEATKRQSQNFNPGGLSTSVVSMSKECIE